MDFDRHLRMGLLLALLGSSANLAATVHPMGTYNCCGDNQCDVLKSTCACKNAGDCTASNACNSYSKCCSQACANNPL